MADALKPTRRYRRWLRISWSVGWGILAVLLCVLWVRSLTRGDICGVEFNGEVRTSVVSESGRIFFMGLDFETYRRVIGMPKKWDLRSEPIAQLFPMAKTQEELLKMSGIPNFPGFEFTKMQHAYRIIIPHWFAVLVSATLVGTPWLTRRMDWRFSLRTLLLATTLLSLLLGLVAWSMT